MEAWIVKNNYGDLIAADDDSRDKLQKIPQGQVVKIKYTLQHDYQFHKKMMAFFQTTFDMQEHFDSFEHYRRWLVMKAGWYDSIVAPNGKVVFVAKSISYDKMEDDEKQKLFSACIDIFLQELGKGITESDLLRVIDYA